jgi:heme-degrading monooxygenase HmoA
MYISMSTLSISPDRAPELIEAFSRRSGLVEGHEGFIDLQVWQADRDPGEIVMVSRWQSRPCFTAYMKSPDHRASHNRISPSLQAAIKLTSLQHMHGFEVVAH